MKYALEAEFYKPSAFRSNLLRSAEAAGKALSPYLIVIAFILACAYLHSLLTSQIGFRAPFITFYPAVAICALLGGGAAGLLATALSAALADYLSFAPAYSFKFAEFGDRLALSVFVASGLIVSFTAERLKRANLRARELEASRLEDVERQVRERTEELAQTAATLQRETAERMALQERFRHVIEFFPTAMIIVDENGRVDLVNQEAERIFGYSREEMTGQSIDILLSQNDRASHSKHRQIYLRTPSQRPMGLGRELFGLRKDGSVFSLEVALGPIAFPEGKKIVAAITDITERKEIESALSDNEERMRLMFDSLRDHAVIMVDPDGKIVSWNAGAERLLGYSKDEILGRNFEMFFAPQDVAAGEPRRELQLAAEHGYSESERPRVRRDGSRFTASVTLNAVRDASGALRGFVKVTRDISLRKRFETQLIESNERFAVAAEAADLGFWDFDPQAKVVRWDENMFRLRGIAQETGNAYDRRFEFIHPDDLPNVEAKLADAAAGLSRFETEFRILRPSDGSMRHIRSAANLRDSANGLGPRLFGVSIDVTDLKQTQLELERARDAAEAASRAKSEFLATVSHEIRTPMNGVIGMNALLLESELDERQRKMAGAIRDSANSLLSIIDDILDFSKLEAGKVGIEDSDFDLKRVVDQAVELFAPRAAEKGLQLSADTTAISRPGLRGDAARLRQIMLNLLSNAIKFTESGSVALKISTSDEATDRTRIRFEVTDTGTGIDPKVRDRLFEPFEQADSSIRRRFGGTGLGLSISKRLVELMGGQIGVNERQEGGSVFWFEAMAGHARKAAMAKPDETPTSHRKRQTSERRGRILLAEDNPVNVDLARMILEGVGHIVDVAKDGAHAIDVWGREHYDVVLMDVQMPVVDGLAATREIRLRGPEGARVPIIAMTANAMREDRQRCFDAGMNDYLAKPFTPTTLIAKVGSWIDRSSPPLDPAPPVEPDPVAERPVLDSSAFDDLRASLTEATFWPLLRRFIDDLGERTLTIMQLRSNGEIEAIGREVHKLIMGSGVFGAAQVLALARLLQDACRSGDAARALPLVDCFLPASRAAQAALRERSESCRTVQAERLRRADLAASE